MIEALGSRPESCCFATVESADTITVFATPQPGFTPGEVELRLRFETEAAAGKRLRIMLLNELPGESSSLLSLVTNLLDLWEELLGHTAIGMLDSFFALGGDSLLAIRMLTRVRAHFLFAPSIDSFFEAPTLQALAAYILAGRTRAAEPAPAPRPLRERRAVAPLEPLTALPRESVHRLFERQVELRPEAVALTAGVRNLTYRELNRMANGYARELVRLDMPPGSLVAVSLDRSPELIAALIGILKAGAAFLPLDAAYPVDRLGFLLEDSAARALITDAGRVAKFPNWTGATLLTADVALGDDDHPSLPVSPDHLAYVMYTSGSTGTPKGVEIPHRGIIRLLFGTTYARFGPDTVFLQLAPVSFDASTLEIWGALLHGGRMVLYPGHTPDPTTLGAVIRQEGVTTLWLTSTLFNALVDDAPEVLAPVEQLLTGGEALSVPHVLRALELLPDTELINGYGPTESTTFTCCYSIPRHWEQPPASIPIGHPIAWTQVFLLDSEMAPVPDGATGELFIGGEGLALGYRNRPELTRQAFPPNPFPEGGPVLYRTGDLARRLPGGALEFVGRLDGQVKLRGFRIELGEIESTLARHPGIRQAAVTVLERDPGGKYLAAFLVPQPGAEPSAAELRDWLAGLLPAHMVPSTFQMLERLPVNANGKLDRRALPHSGTGGELPRASWAQESLWLQDRLYPGIPAYNESWTIRMEGPLDTAALGRALDLLIERHAALRTNFALEERVLRQVVRTSWESPLRQRDQAPEALDQAVRQEAAQPFDLARGPVLRALLLRLREGSSVLVLTIHHIAIDGWSLGILFRELSLAYNALARGQAPLFAELPTTCAIFAEKERRRGHIEELAYWQGALRGAEPLRLPFDRHLLEAAQLAGDVHRTTLDAGLVTELNRLAQGQHATLYMVLLAAFQALLHRATGQGEILVGSPMANRLRAETEGLIGYFVNTLPSRLRVTPGATFRSLLESVRSSLLAAYARQEVPSRELAGLLRPATLDAVLVLQNTPGAELHFEGVDVRVATVQNGTAKFSLTLSIEPRDGALTMEAEYNTGRFSAGAVARLMTSYRDLLAAVAAHPDEAIAAHPLPGLPMASLPAVPAHHATAEADPRLARIWRDILGVSDVRAEDDFFELGGHSLAAARLIGRVEKELDVRLSLAALFQAPTLGALSALVRDRALADSGQAIPIQPAGTRRPFHCLSGGPMFRSLARRLGKDQPFLGVPGPDLARLPLPFRLEDLAAEQRQAIRRIQPEGPYTLGGWSAAAALAYEVARQLQAEGETVSLLVLFDGHNPTTPLPSLVAAISREAPSERVRRLLARVWLHTGNLARAKAGEIIPYLRDRWKWSRVLLRMHLWSIGYRTCERFGLRLPKWMLDGGQILLHCYFNYRPEAYTGPALIFRHTRRPGNDPADPMLGWNGLLTGPVSLCDVPGDHSEIFEEPNVSIMAEKLREALRDSSINY